MIQAGAARAVVVVAAYAALSVAMTWPLATRLGSSIAGDLGDPLFVAWVISWVTDHLTRVLGGDVSAWQAMWTAPIFAPEPSTLTYSDHFLAQAVQALPLWWLTANPLVGYNVVFLATMTLTAAMVHGFAVRLTGTSVAGFSAGVLATFNTYRSMWTVSHLQILSTHWWVAGVWALDVHIATRSRAALAAAVASFIALYLSSSYLLAYGAPFTAALALWSLIRHGRVRDARAWAGVAVAGAVPLLAVAPLLVRYFSTRSALGASRTLPELVGSSATLALYGEAWPWLAPLVALAVIGVLVPAARSEGSRPARAALLALAAVAFVLALGPVVRLGGRDLPGPYVWLWHAVPGFDGLRVPHRFIAIGSILLSLLCGIGAAWLWRTWPGRAGVLVAIALVTRQAWQPPFPIGVPMATPLVSPPAYLAPAATLPTIYQRVAGLPPDAVVVEFPFGDQAYEIRYTYFSGLHRRRLVNGYSGVLPPSYTWRQAWLRDPVAGEAGAWRALSPATHAVVHGGAWADGTGERLMAWLQERGARRLAEDGDAVLYEVPR